MLWTLSDSSGLVRFDVATDAGFANIVASQSVVASNPLLPVKWRSSGLSAGREYHYRATAPGALGEVATGRFRTAAPSGANNSLRFGVTGDWRGELSSYPGLKNAPAANLDFFVKLGDTIYADFPSPDLNQPQAVSLDEFRIKHREVYSTRNGHNAWKSLQQSTAIFSTIDDHEVTNDFAGGAPLGSDSRFFVDATGAESFLNQTPLYRRGLQAFGEYNAIEQRSYKTPGNDLFQDAPDLYRYQTFGKAAAMFLVDGRSFRDDQLPNPNLGSPLSVGSFLANSLLDGTRSLLGDVQLARLQNDLISAQAEGVIWKFVMVPEPIQNLGPAIAADRYEGYAFERAKLLQFIQQQGIDNVVFVSADIHGTVVNNLTYQDPADPRGIFAPQRSVNAFEITTGSLAFAEPFGPTVISLAESLGLLGVAQIPPPFNTMGFPSYRAFYDFLGTMGQQAIQEAILKQLINAQLSQVPSPYDPVGLTDNLPASSRFMASLRPQLLAGAWTATNSFGWTEFSIDGRTHDLLVTTYGVMPYTPAQIAANPSLYDTLSPTVVSQFRVSSVPEPSSWALLLLGVAPLGTRWVRAGKGPRSVRNWSHMN
jgi:phosphodiesterase/alkaline phosphatase D-like protein